MQFVRLNIPELYLQYAERKQQLNQYILVDHFHKKELIEILSLEAILE